MSELADKNAPKRSTLTVKQVVRNARKRFLEAETLVQAGKTPYNVVYEDGPLQLRYYPPISEPTIKVGGCDIPVEKNAYRVPIVLVAPLAVNMYIYDLFQDRSLVRYLRAKGFEVYLLDWGVPDRSDDAFTLSTYFAEKLPNVLSEVRQHSGEQQLTLHGWSLGGLFSTCYAALGDPNIVNMTLIGAPFDYHANGQLGKQYQRLGKQLVWLKNTMGLQVHDSPKRWWRSPGWVNSLAFKLTNPISSIQGYLELLKNLHNEEYIITHATNSAFLDDMLAYPGGVMQDIVHHLCGGNILVSDELPMPKHEPKGTVRNINANLLLVCGDNDPIVTRENSVVLLDYVSSSDQTIMDVSGGHMGILSGSKAPVEIWPKLVAWLAERSQ